MSFQSTPVIANGRIDALQKLALMERGFNPRPLLLTGESPGVEGARWLSILFQSTPVIANGRIAASGRAAGVAQRVSIHARYC